MFAFVFEPAHHAAAGAFWPERIASLSAKTGANFAKV